MTVDIELERRRIVEYQKSEDQDPPELARHYHADEVGEFLDEIERLRCELEEHEAGFNLYWEASRRATKMWQEKTGEEGTWPDMAHLIVWLMDRLKEQETVIAEAFKAGFDWSGEGFNGEYNTRTPKELEMKLDEAFMDWRNQQ